MSMTYAVEQRLRLLDFLLARYGHVGRPELMDYFGISTPQASKDIAQYVALYPSNVKYDASTKRYRATPTFTRLFP